jgi:AhpD family alkylhydroperoxidase
MLFAAREPPQDAKRYKSRAGSTARVPTQRAMVRSRLELWRDAPVSSERRRRTPAPAHTQPLDKEAVMTFHGVDGKTQFRRMRELAPEVYRAFLEFDQKAFKDGAIPGKTKELIALGIAHITQCPWCIDAHTKKASVAGASDAEIVETTFVAMAMAAGAAWSHGGLALQCLQEHKGG